MVSQLKNNQFVKHRIYTNHSLSVGQQVVLEEKQNHYVNRVLRVKKNQSIILFNDTGEEFHGLVLLQTNKQTTIFIQEKETNNCESSLQITLALSLINADRFAWAIQKATELGVYQIQPLFAGFGQVKLSADKIVSRLQHWQQICISACEQCGRSIVPQILPPCTIIDSLQQSTQQLILCDPTGKKKLTDLSLSTGNIQCYIGPEGGWQEAELQQFTAYQSDVISLGKRILRAETAAVAIITLVQHQWGDLS